MNDDNSTLEQGLLPKPRKSKSSASEKSSFKPLATSMLGVFSVLLVALSYLDSFESLLPLKATTPLATYSSSHSDRYKLLTRVLRNQGVLQVRALIENPTNAQGLALDWLASTDNAQSVTTSHIHAQDWTTNAVLRPLVEKYALAVTYYESKGYKWKDHTGWLESEDPCLYQGVTCSERTIGVNPMIVVTGLDFNAIGYEGKLPSEIELLRSLDSLDLGEFHSAEKGTIDTRMVFNDRKKLHFGNRERTYVKDENPLHFSNRDKSIKKRTKNLP